MFKMKTMIFSLLLALLSCLLTYGNPLSGLGGEEMKFPYDQCKTYSLGGKKGLPMTDLNPFRNGSELAFYPMTDKEMMLYLDLMFQDVHFKIKVQGSMMSLQICNPSNRNCNREKFEGVKHSDYIRSQEWNLVYVIFEPHQLSFYIGQQKVKSIQIEDKMNLNNAHWSVRVIDSPKKKERNPYEPEVLYLVQFKCKAHSDTTTAKHYTSTTTEEYTPSSIITSTPQVHVTHESSTEPASHVTPAPHVDGSTKAPDDDKPKGNNLVGLIVGLVVLALILIAVVIVVYNVIKKKQSLNLNEKSPLQNEQRATK